MPSHAHKNSDVQNCSHAGILEYFFEHPNQQGIESTRLSTQHLPVHARI